MQQPLKLNRLTGYHLKALDGDFGKLVALYFDDKNWIVRYFVARSTEWLVGRKLLIVPTLITDIDPKDKIIDVDLTLQQVENSPLLEAREIGDEEYISLNYEQEIYRYYRLLPYWHSEPAIIPMGDSSNSNSNPNPNEIKLVETSESFAHRPLHSSEELKNFGLHATDGNIGHIADLIIEEESWRIRYLEINTHHWLPGKHVLLAPAWIKKIDWQNKTVLVDLDCNAIKTAPDYEPAKIISRQYQLDLYQHYGKNLTGH